MLRTMIYAVIAATIGILGGAILNPSAYAADFTVKQRVDGTKYMMMTGDIVDGDADRFRNAYQHGVDTLIVNSFGGNAYAAAELAELVATLDLNTAAYDKCYSGCTLIWAAGNERWLKHGAVLGFHPPYTLDVDFLNTQLDWAGWHGVQHSYASIVIWFTGQYFIYGVNDPVAFMAGLSNSGPSVFFEITTNNLSIIGGRAY